MATNPFLDSNLSTSKENPFLEGNLPKPDGPAVVGAGQFSPDGIATAQRQATSLGVPAEVLVRNPEQAARMELQRKIEGVRERNPALADWLGDPRRLGLVKDEVEGVEKLAGTLSKPKQQDWAQELLANMVSTGIGVYGHVNRASTGKSTPEDVESSTDVLRSLPAGAVRGIGMAVGGVGETYNLGERSLDRGLSGVGVPSGGGPARSDVPIWLRPGDSFVGTGQYLKRLADWIAPPKQRQTFGTQVAEGVGQVGPMVIQSIYAPQTLPASTYGMGVDQMADAVREKGAYGTGRGDLAIATGGLAQGALERLGIERLVERLPPNIRSSTMRYIADISIAAATEGATEAGQQVAQNAALQAFVDPKQSLTEGVADNAAQGGAVGAIVRALLGIPGVPRSRTRAAAEQVQNIIGSQDANADLAAATQAAAELKLGARSPDDMRAIVRQLVGEDSNLYLDAEHAQTLFQSAPQVLQDLVGGQEALAEQMATGQITISKADWMAAVPQLPNWSEILQHTRTTPEGLSPAEVEGLDVEAIARELGVQEDWQESADSAQLDTDGVRQSVLAQLAATERYTPAQADSQARLWQAVFGRLGEVTGQDPMALYERYSAGIQIADAPAEGGAPRTLMQRGMDTLRGLFGRPQVATDARGQQTIEREGSAYVQRAGQWLLADDQGEARDFLTLDQARTEAERTGGEIVQDDPIEGQRQTWSVALPDTAAREVLAGDILFQGGAAPRGQIQIGTDRAMQISLFKGADLSTFLHESGHFFLEVYRDLATAEDAAPQLRSDLDALLKWFGVESADQIGVDQHEQFARGFEAYLGEGKAPTPELQSVFSQFKQWILGVYRSLRNLDVELTDDVRGVFDRMLASQEEIEAAQARVGFEPIARDLAEAQALGMTERQFADYQAQVAAAREQAEADLMAQLQEADARARERWWKDELATIRAEVEAEVEATPIVRAYRVLTGRKEAGGEPVPEQLQGLKLDRAVLAATYGDGLLDKMGRVYARKGGTHPEEVATLLGFTSADELVQGLWTVRQTLAGVSAEADARMQARHGEPMTDGTLPQRALDAVHGSRKIQLLERELGVLADLAKEPRPNRRELKAVAQAVLAEKTARQIRPNEYLVAERKAARSAAQAAAAGKYADALQAKRQQALNAVLFAEARAVQQEVESKVSYIRRQMTPQARERLGKAGADYLEAMDTIADTYEFRDVSGRAVVRRQSLRQWVEARQADDDLTAVSDALLARVEAESVTNYADLPIAEFRELHDAVTNIARLAKLKNKLLSNKDQRDWESAQAELAGAIRGAIAEGKPLPLSDADLTAMQKMGATYTGLMDWVLRPETVVEWLDGGETGPWHDFLWNQAEAAQQQRIELRNRVGGMLEQTMKALTPAQRADLNRLVYVPSLGRSLSKNTIVAAALNMGNAGNRDKLMRGGFIGKNAEVVQFTPQNIAEMLGHLTPADAQMVQGIWDAVNSLWPDIVEQQRRLSGVAPEQVEPMPLIFTAADGSTVSLRGGYYPAVYDPRAGAGGVKQARAAEEQIMGGTFSRAMTSKGHTKERTEYAAPMLLDYHRVLSRHLNDVITDISHRGYVKQALRVLEDQELKNLIQQRLSEGAYHSLYGSVKNAVRGASVSEPGSGPVEKLGDAVLTNTAVAALGFRLPLVFANTVVAPIQAAARVDPKYLATGYAAYYRSPGKMTEMIHSLSPFMEERSNSLDSSYQVVLGKLSGKRGIRAAAMKMAMEVHRWTVPLAERAIWLGRYQQAQAQGVSIDEAVRLADKSIRTTQQAGAPKDLSAAERDPRYKWVRMFIGPMIIMNNRLQESGLRGLYLGRVQSPARALGTWLSAGVLSNAVFELLMMRGPDGGDDDEKGWDDWSAWLARKTLLFPFQTIPLLRDVAGGIDAAIEGKPSMGRPNPIVDAGVALAKFGQAAWKEGRDWIADDDEPDAEKLIKTGVRAAGPLTGIPSNQMLTTGEYLYDVGTGQYTPDNPAEAAAYLMYRRPKDEQ
ncbi:TPA: hypothetical protein ACOFD0_001328 [Stenotrophomonas maltophilia]